MTAKDIDVKAVSWGNIEVGDRPSNKADDSGQMVKSVLTICGFDAMALNTEQLRQICGTLKIQGYRSKPKAEVLRIMAVAKLHQSFYDTCGCRKSLSWSKWWLLSCQMTSSLIVLRRNSLN